MYNLVYIALTGFAGSLFLVVKNSSKAAGASAGRRQALE
jgi:hypothetical protein